MSKKIKIFNLRSNLIHYFFFLLVCSLIVGVIYYNKILSEREITLLYEIEIKSKDFKTIRFFSKNKFLIKNVFDQLYSNNDKKKFQIIKHKDSGLQLTSIKSFNARDINKINKFETEHDAWTSIFIQSYEEKLKLEIKSFLNHNYFIKKNIAEVLEDNEINKNLFNYLSRFNVADLDSYYEESNDFLLVLKSKNIEEYLKFKEFDFKIDYTKTIKNIHKKISFTDLFILLIIVLIIYLSYLIFFKIIKTN